MLGGVGDRVERRFRMGTGWSLAMSDHLKLIIRDVQLSKILKSDLIFYEDEMRYNISNF